MPARRLRLSGSLAALVRSLHPGLKRKIRAALRMIIEEPLSGKGLKDELSGLRSFRVGRSRIVYRVDGEVIEVIAIGPRKTIYEETFRLIRKSERPS